MRVSTNQNGNFVLDVSPDESRLIKAVIHYETVHYADLDPGIHERSTEQFQALKAMLDCHEETSACITLSPETFETLRRGLYYAVSQLDEVFEDELETLEAMEETLNPTADIVKVAGAR